MLTRHLYEVDEVCAALSWCIRSCRVKEAAFWAKELLDSEMNNELYTTLLDAWIWNFGIGKMEALRVLYNLFHREEETTETDILAYVCSLSRLSKSCRDNSIFVFLSLGLHMSKQYDRVSPCPDLDATLEREQATPLEAAFLRACYQGKSFLAWQLSRPLWQANSERTWMLTRLLQHRKHGSSTLNHCLEILEEYDEMWNWSARAAAIGAVCLDQKRLCLSMYAVEWSVSSDVVSQLPIWEERLGRRKRREFAIPRDCLYYVTSRGRVTYQKKNLRRGYVVSEQVLRGCPFWDRVLDEVKPETSDEAKELFWDTYFPDDIPDEWSLEDQEKSHGTGVLSLAEKPNYYKYANKWFYGLECRGLWMGFTEAMRALMKLGGNTMDNLSWQDLYELCDFTKEMEDWLLEPVKRREVVTAEAGTAEKGNIYQVVYSQST